MFQKTYPSIIRCQLSCKLDILFAKNNYKKNCNFANSNKHFLYFFFQSQMINSGISCTRPWAIVHGFVVLLCVRYFLEIRNNTFCKLSKIFQ